MTYAGLEVAQSKDAPHLGGSVKVGDPYTFCPSVWDYVITRFGIESALDLGSGSGNAALYFHNRGVRTVAVDGYAPSIAASVFPAILQDLTVTPVMTRVDFVHCQEVAEHIEERFIDNLLASMLCGKIILMTHAMPGQPGHHHVNLQPPEYWIDRLGSRGGVLLEEDTRRVRLLAERDGAGYMSRSGMIFANTARL